MSKFYKIVGWWTEVILISFTIAAGLFSLLQLSLQSSFGFNVEIKSEMMSPMWYIFAFYFVNLLTPKDKPVAP